jgi:hypothetical protein
VTGTGRRLAVLATTVLAAASLLAASRTTAVAAPALSGQTLPGTRCPAFPSNAVWNTPITHLPVDKDSAKWLAAMDASGTYLHPDYGPSGTRVPYGIPWNRVTDATPTTPIRFEYAPQSNRVRYPFTARTSIEGGSSASGDRHAFMVNQQTCTLYELWDARYSARGSTAGSGAVWKLTSDTLRPAGWTSADAAGLPILPLLVDYDQVKSGVMDHAIPVTAACTQESYLWPARHEAGQADADCPPMGARFRLEASFRLPASTCSKMCQTVLTSMKTYGLVVADNGSNWFFQGTADSRWTSTEVDQVKQIPARDFQAVDESCLRVSANSARAYQPGTAAYGARCG